MSYLTFINTPETRTLVRLATMVITALSAGANPVDRPTVGAIRWDAWSGGEVTREVERTLSPVRYHHRLPWFAELDADDKAHIDGSAPGVMEQEINYAAAAGLDYWAFLLYPKGSEMSEGLEQYLASPDRGEIKFCLILHNSIGLEEDVWALEQARFVRLLQEPGYVTVAGGRPLVYAFGNTFDEQFPVSRFNDLRAALKKAGMDPYFVYMGWKPVDDFAKKSSLGFDAVSAYAYASDVPTFHELAELVEQDYWQAATAHQTPLVPFVTTGWDKMPRKDNPVFWEDLSSSYHHQDVFPSMATPCEIESTLRSALDLVRSYPGLNPANTVIVYAWNEYDEGGWLAPTWTPSGEPDMERLEAVRRVLNPAGAPLE
ncbi:hypothetical protein [Synoicihabitans lomoniglobus]|uniref:Uncharacterized protein n=1 Tax=Synoicihabitans lomoniglobus TaxID=2909285 RepID=A0AAE9ZTL9_9BACT|nr:hypothetical protein [Opitutaceae bacterium LMO-M01]WED64051.1 hypothetical protein PXH66_17065 [Opitutaceae bacterium LMO-M01]